MAIILHKLFIKYFLIGGTDCKERKMSIEMILRRNEIITKSPYFGRRGRISIVILKHFEETWAKRQRAWARSALADIWQVIETKRRHSKSNDVQNCKNVSERHKTAPRSNR